MPDTRNISAKQRILPRPGHAVKARVIAAGLTLGQLADRAKIARSTLSEYLSGRTRNVHGQFEIMMAFSSLTGEALTIKDFWGELTAPEAA